MILPLPEEVRAAREELGFSRKRAARMVHVSESAWCKWESTYTSDEYRQIPGAAWELFIRKTDSRRKACSEFTLKVSLR